MSNKGFDWRLEMIEMAERILGMTERNLENV
jgi:hypothetical protein